jgi:hypothetical protein
MATCCVSWKALSLLGCSLSWDSLGAFSEPGNVMDQNSQWKTEEYHNHDMHVLAQHRTVENSDLPGHGAQWDFTVKVTPRGAGPESAEAETAKSDAAVFYSTQAIAENLGFLKGREIIEGRAKHGIGGDPGGRVL